ncbi:Protein of unknown function [Gryllus bimaculatus]|nr:Protein of unknown function [Gryllus bimaculatus]
MVFKATTAGFREATETEFAKVIITIFVPPNIGNLQARIDALSSFVSVAEHVEHFESFFTLYNIRTKCEYFEILH